MHWMLHFGATGMCMRAKRRWASSLKQGWLARACWMRSSIVPLDGMGGL